MDLVIPIVALGTAVVVLCVILLLNRATELKIQRKQEQRETQPSGSDS